MSTHKHIDRICITAVILSLVLCAVFMNGEIMGIQAASKVIGYEQRLFDTSKVHTIDIIIDDWNGFLETAQSEEYSVCDLVIDGEPVNNVGIRGKGNTSLSSVASMDSDRYSFKIEFDQYDSTKTYHGLDKLSLNNLIQDNTYMKDYLSYQMMGQFGAPAPLCSYAYLNVNGQDWGLYLAVEAVEESFLQRNYGADYGQLYKPDNMNMGGGRGNGKNFDFSQLETETENTEVQPKRSSSGGFTVPAGIPTEPGMSNDGIPFQNAGPDNFGGMGSSETKLQYIDDDPDSYSTIFDSAKTDITEADKTRLIASLKQLSEYRNLENILNTDDVLRYFVVHNYLVNGDSYTGSMIHNYYLYEDDGCLSMIPWDYNLAFGTFQSNNAASAVNYDIDNVLSDRPMQAWIFSDDAYSSQYYTLYAQLLEQVDAQNIISQASELIAPYVEKDPTAFCSYTEFKVGVDALKEFCRLRSESVRLQLIGSTETVDAGSLDLSAMGTMGGGMGGRGNRSDAVIAEGTAGDNAAIPAMPDGMTPPDGMQFPGGMPQFGAGETEIADTAPSGGDSAGSFNPDRGHSNFRNTGSSQSTDTGKTTAIYLAASVLFLAVGLVIAFKFKR